jgi:hypothetical protein
MKTESRTAESLAELAVSVQPLGAGGCVLPSLAKKHTSRSPAPTTAGMATAWLVRSVEDRDVVID